MSKSAFPESDNFAFVESGSMYQAQTEPVMDPGAVTVEVSGTIKWFDVSKGFGFIIPDDGSPDVLLHVTCLQRGGYQVAYEGTRIVCDAVRARRGMQAITIKSMDYSAALHPSQTQIARTHETV